ncbi:MAG TPA: phosphoribosyltransferase family protein [Bacteroidia bacterium]|nr:phosphoribosyltransferase family protein [Bacteroidia bacterium]
MSLPQSRFEAEKDSELDRIFYGRVPIQKAGAYLLFEKSGKVQKILHEIKYKGNQLLAYRAGQWYGEKLKEHPDFANIHGIIPVPLHAKKQKQRGFNQSEEFANGISSALGIPVVKDCLVRTKFTSTQTKKSKAERWDNVKDKFELIHPEQLKNKTVLLVDDVITTGATIDACYQALSNAEGINVSVVCLAYAKKY